MYLKLYTIVYACFFCSFVSGANDRNRLSEAAILEMTPPTTNDQQAADIIFCTFENDDDVLTLGMSDIETLENHSFVFNDK